jgi:hypothetical protein
VGDLVVIHTRWESDVALTECKSIPGLAEPRKEEHAENGALQWRILGAQTQKHITCPVAGEAEKRTQKLVQHRHR